MIGSLETQTSPSTPGRLTVAQDILRAWAEWTNARGGIDGHPVRAIVMNDNDDPAQAISDIHTLVQRDHILALVGNLALTTLPTWAPYVTKERVPVIGGGEASADWYTNPIFYPTSTTIDAELYGQVFVAKQALGFSAKVATLFCIEVTACQAAIPLVRATAAKQHVPVVYTGLASMNAASYTPECLAMKQAGATAIIPAGVNTLNVVRDCRRQGYKPLVVGTFLSPSPIQIQQNPGELVGIEGPTPGFPVFQKFPANREYFAAVSAYAPQYLPGGSAYNQDNVPGDTAQVWEAAAAFTKAVQDANIPKNTTATTADVIRGLSMFKDETLGGLTAPLSYGDGSKPNGPIDCFALYRTVDTRAAYQTVPPNKFKYYCE